MGVMGDIQHNEGITMQSDLVYKLDGIKVVWSQKYAVYEVWQLVQDGPDDNLWDCVADTPDKEWAIAVADEIWNRMPTRETEPRYGDYCYLEDYYDSGIDF